jgi:hypothetical protein
VANISIKQMYVYIGKDTAQEVAIKCVADVSSSLSAKYFLFHTPAGLKHYAWIDTGTSVDPAPAGGWVGHQVTIAPNASATAVASALQAVLDVITGFDATVSGDVVTLVSSTTGYCQPARDADLLANKTGFSFQTTVLGQAKESAGCIQGDIEVTGFEVTKVEVKCHATGATIQQEIPVGVSKPEIAFTLQDTSKEKIEKIFNMMGYGSLTGVGADKQKVFGYGTSIVGADIPKLQVSFHPVALDASNKSEDWNFWKTSIGVDSFTFAAEDVATIPVKFAVYPDDTKHKSINLIMIGDEANALPA